MDTLAELKYKKSRERKKMRKFYLVLAIILILSGIYFVFFYGYFQVKEISAGSLQDDSWQFFNEYRSQNISFWQKRADLIWLQKNEFAAFILSKKNNLASVLISKRWPNALEISSEKRKPVLEVCGLNGCFLSDDSGFIFSVSEVSGVFPKITVNSDINQGQSGFESDFVKKLVDFDLKLKKNLSIFVENYKLDFYLYCLTRQGWFIKIDPESDFSSRIVDLELVLREEIKDRQDSLDYIDLTISDRAYFKLK